MKTYALKASEIEKKWRVFDATDQPLGRLATRVAVALRGKDKPTFSPHLDMGDFVIVTNAEKVKATGQKLAQKLYRRHSGYFGGLKEKTLAQQLQKHPDRVIRDAVWGMLPKGRLGRRQIRHLKVYAGPHHPHEAQVNAGLGKNARKNKETSAS
ncbi:MAG TPA: 50S ribosomal protein L13 [Dehalococcoidia bacterium]|nr:50S ribosomal protein L13 [Dehalococcoidia bacterium]